VQDIRLYKRVWCPARWPGWSAVLFLTQWFIMLCL